MKKLLISAKPGIALAGWPAATVRLIFCWAPAPDAETNTKTAAASRNETVRMFTSSLERLAG
jgi:hypothetical protein